MPNDVIEQYHLEHLNAVLVSQLYLFLEIAAKKAQTLDDALLGRISFHLLDNTPVVVKTEIHHYRDPNLTTINRIFLILLKSQIKIGNLFYVPLSSLSYHHTVYKKHLANLQCNRGRNQSLAYFLPLQKIVPSGYYRSF